MTREQAPERLAWRTIRSPLPDDTRFRGAQLLLHPRFVRRRALERLPTSNERVRFSGRILRVAWSYLARVTRARDTRAGVHNRAP